MDGKEHGLSTFWTDSDDGRYYRHDKSMQCLLWWLLLQCDIFQQCWKYVEKWSHKGSFGKIACWAIGKQAIWKRDSIGVETSSNENAASWFEFWEIREVPLVSEGWRNMDATNGHECGYVCSSESHMGHTVMYKIIFFQSQLSSIWNCWVYSLLFPKIASKNLIWKWRVSKNDFYQKILENRCLNSKTILRAFLHVLVKSNRFDLAC